MNTLSSKHLCLSFSQKQRQQAWEQAQNYSNHAARWNAYLNYLCLDILSDYWEIDEDSLSVPPCHDLWEFVNGSILNIRKTRLILIPSDTIDTEEFSIPQEWVDIASWQGDYYVAVQVSPDDCWLRMWGFTTYAQIKNEGEYSLRERTYSLSRYSLNEEINGLWILPEFNHLEKNKNQELSDFSSVKVQSLVTKLCSPTPYLPRLELDFQDWSAILTNETLRKQIYESRTQKIYQYQSSIFQSLSPQLANEKKITSSRFSHLSQWLHNIYETGWEKLEQLLVSEEYAYVLRNGNAKHTNFNDNVEELIQQVYQGNNHKQKKAARRLGEINNDQLEVIEALNHLIQTTKDEETRWTAAESLWTLDPNSLAVGVRRFKNLGLQIGGSYIALMIAILPQVKEQIAILLRVYPMGQQTRLPENLQLSVLDDQENIFLEAKSRAIDNYIQLKFSGTLGEHFSVKVALQSAEIIEDFVI